MSVRQSDLSRFVQRELILLLALSAIAVVAFLLTRAAAAYEARQASIDAASWYAKGQASLADGRPSEAVTALRRAVSGRRDEWLYAEMLAQALIASGQVDASRQLLLLWRAEQPENVRVNVQLARLEAGAGKVNDAVDYYESALYGQWSATAGDARRLLRQELVAYLLDHGDRGRALSHVLALSANQPDDAPRHIQTARLFLAVGDAARALDHFERARRLDPRAAEATAGAAEASFALGDYARVLTLLRPATDEGSRALARAAQAVLVSDPLLPRIPSAERRRRMVSALEYTAGRLSTCSGITDNASTRAELSMMADAVVAFSTSLSPRVLAESPDLYDQGLRLVFRGISAAGASCPAGDRDDTLLRVARRHQATEP